MVTLTKAEDALRNAHKAGDVEAAKKLASVVKRERERRSSDPAYTSEGAHMNDPDVPGYVSDDIPWLNQPEPEEGVISKAADVVGGVAEVPLTVATGMAGVPVGIANMIHQGAKAGVSGGAEGLDKYLRSRGPEEAFESGVGAVTYQPKTDTAQTALSKLAEAMKPLPPVLAPSLAQANMVGQVSRGVAPIARARVLDPTIKGLKVAGQKVADSKTRGTQALAQALTERKQSKQFGKGSAGAAELSQARLRAERARELDDPIDLTVGEATRNQDALRFQHEQQKLESGKPFREAQHIKNQKVANNLDMWIDEAGSELVAIGDKGRHLDDALKKVMNQKSQRVFDAYREAEQAGHMADNVQLKTLTDLLNDPIKRAEAVNDGVLKTTRRVLIETGAAREVDGILVPNDIDLVSGEQIRRSIGENVGLAASDRRQGRLLKRAYDQDTEGAGGQLYKRARSQRREFAEQFENNELVRKLTGENPKSGEKLIAIESMVDTILAPSSGLASVDRLKKLRHMLLKDPDGRQSWKEVQGELVERIKTQTFRTSNFDENGNPIPSYAGLNKAISELDRSGKLDIILSKKGAEKMRTLREVVKTIYTAPPGTINHSNTATVIASLLDGAIFAHGIPVPLANATRMAVNKIKDRKLQAKIKQHLRGVL